MDFNPTSSVPSVDPQLKSVEDNLTIGQKIVAAIAAAIFAIISAAAYVYHLFSREVTVQTPQQDSVSTTTKSVLPSNTTPPSNVRKLEYGDHTLRTLYSIDDIQLFPEDDDTLWSLDSEDDIQLFAEDDDSDVDFSESTSSTSTSASAPIIIDGKEYSLRTVKCLEHLDAELTRLDRKRGQAIDNGDCFFDAFAQALSRLIDRAVTLQDLRLQVSQEVQKLDKGPEKDNWIKKIIDEDFGGVDSYEDYRDGIVLDKEATQKAPVWGQPSRDGVILCRLYQVNLVLYEVGCVNEEPSAMHDSENFYIGDQMYPLGEKFTRTIEMAAYPGHFMPVWDTLKSN